MLHLEFFEKDRPQNELIPRYRKGYHMTGGRLSLLPFFINDLLILFLKID